MFIHVLKGRKTNRFMCLFFVSLTVIAVTAAGIAAFLKKPVLSETFCILATITGSFSLFYGALWMVWSRKEQRKELELKEALSRQYDSEDSDRAVFREFIIPRARLTETARKRFRRITRWMGITGLGVFLFLGGILYFFKALESLLQLFYLVQFCLVIIIAGILVQGILYLKYYRSVPSRILLYPGKFVVDDRVFSSENIHEIRVSPEHVYNLNSTAVFRELQIRTDKQRTEYRIDYHMATSKGEQPFWEEYSQFVGAVLHWGAGNGVEVNIAFMD